MESPIKDYIFSNWGKLIKTEIKPKSISLMKVGGRPGNKSSISFFIFTEGNKIPSYFLKINRDPSYSLGIRNEYTKYSDIYRKLSNEIKKTIPQPIFFEETQFYSLFCETVIPGKKLGKQIINTPNAQLKKTMTKRLFSLSLQWLAKFHKESYSGFIEIDDAFVEKYGHMPIKILLKTYPNETKGWEDTLFKIENILKKYRGIKIPLVAQQGDYTYYNILIENDNIGVVDWEECEPQGFPFPDLFYFLFHFSFIFEEEENARKSFESFFRNGSWSDELAKNSLDDFSRQHNLPVDLTLTMAPLYCIELLLKNYSLHRDPKSIQLNSFTALDLILNLWQENLSR